VATQIASKLGANSGFFPHICMLLLLSQEFSGRSKNSFANW